MESWFDRYVSDLLSDPIFQYSVSAAIVTLFGAVLSFFLGNAEKHVDNVRRIKGEELVAPQYFAWTNLSALIFAVSTIIALSSCAKHLLF